MLNKRKKEEEKKIIIIELNGVTNLMKPVMKKLIK
jgi:hypothetical protein